MHGVHVEEYVQGPRLFPLVVSSPQRFELWHFEIGTFHTLSI